MGPRTLYAVFPVLAASTEGLLLDSQPLCDRVFDKIEHARMAADLVFNWPLGKHCAAVAACCVDESGKPNGFDLVAALTADDEDDTETSFAMVG